MVTLRDAVLPALFVTVFLLLLFYVKHLDAQASRQCRAAGYDNGHKTFAGVVCETYFRK